MLVELLPSCATFWVQTRVCLYRARMAGVSMCLVGGFCPRGPRQGLVLYCTPAQFQRLTSSCGNGRASSCSSHGWRSRNDPIETLCCLFVPAQDPKPRLSRPEGDKLGIGPLHAGSAGIMQPLHVASSFGAMPPEFYLWVHFWA